MSLAPNALRRNHNLDEIAWIALSCATIKAAMMKPMMKPMMTPKQPGRATRALARPCH
jgi:hypothetical protein